jgi:hypothetical protein
MHAPVASWPFNQAHGDLANQEQTYNPARVAAMQLALDIRPKPREQVLPDGRGNSRREFPGNSVILAAQFLFRFGNRCREFVGIRQQNRTLWR